MDKKIRTGSGWLPLMVRLEGRDAGADIAQDDGSQRQRTTVNSVAANHRHAKQKLRAHNAQAAARLPNHSHPEAQEKAGRRGGCRVRANSRTTPRSAAAVTACRGSAHETNRSASALSDRTTAAANVRGTHPTTPSAQEKPNDLAVPTAGAGWRR